MDTKLDRTVRVGDDVLRWHTNGDAFRGKGVGRLGDTYYGERGGAGAGAVCAAGSVIHVKRAQRTGVVNKRNPLIA